MIFKKLFGGSAEDREAKGRKLREAGDPGGALLAFRKAAEKYGDDRLQSDIDECYDELATRRLAEAKRLIAQGDAELATEELEGALEVVASGEARATIQAFVDSLQRQDAQIRAQEVEVTDEERWLLIRGNWTEAQARELDSHGGALKEAMLGIHRGEKEAARTVIEALLEEALPSGSVRYLWLEAARARLACDAKVETRQALEAYLEQTDAEDIDQAWLGAQIALAHLADDDGDFEAAMAHFTEALNAFEDDPRPFFELGAFLLDKGHAAEAVDVLETASEIGDADQPDWRILQELGIAYAETDRAAEAIGMLEDVISFMVARAHLDFPPRTTTRLAELHESHGKMERAADLWAALSRGSDRANHRRYHEEAARVLNELGLEEEASRMAKRAESLKTLDAES